jgi:hypothetical protein
VFAFSEATPDKALGVLVFIVRDQGVGGSKSSLPDHYFQALKLHFWFFVHSDGVDFVDGARIAGFFRTSVEAYKLIFP